MKWCVRVRPEAELDLLYSAGWYEARRKGLGAEFIEEISRVIRSLEHSALLYEEVFAGVRRVFVRRFPYVVSYQIHGDEVVVVSVLHMRRRLR